MLTELTDSVMIFNHDAEMLPPELPSTPRHSSVVVFKPARLPAGFVAYNAIAELPFAGIVTRP